MLQQLCIILHYKNNLNKFIIMNNNNNLENIIPKIRDLQKRIQKMQRYFYPEIANYSQNEYISLMASELKKAGYKNQVRRDGKIEYIPYTPDEYMLEGSVIEDAQAIDHLISIGLLNNGRCPRCGKSMPTNAFTFTSHLDQNASFAICERCHKEGIKFQNSVKRSMGLPTTNSGCFSLFIVAILFSGLIIYSFL